MNKEKYALIQIEGTTCGIIPINDNPEAEFKTRCYRSAITLLDLYDDMHLIQLIDPETLVHIFIKFLLGGDIEEFMNEVHSCVPSSSKH